MAFGFSIKPIKDILPIAIGAGIVEPLADSFVGRYLPQNQIAFGIGIDDVVIGAAALFGAKRKGMIGGIAKGVLVAKLAKIMTGLFSGALGGTMIAGNVGDSGGMSPNF